MEQFLIAILVALVVYLWLRNKANANTPNSSENSGVSISTQAAFPKTKPKLHKNKPLQKPKTSEKTQILPSRHNQYSNTTNLPSLNTGIADLDGPGMYHRVYGCGPSGHICYLLYSPSLRIYKVGISEPDRLGMRVKDIRQIVPDIKIHGTAVYTNRQNAFEAEQKVIRDNKNYRYRGIQGERSGRSEWFTRKPPGRKPFFTSPETVERKFQEEISKPTEQLSVPDIYTIYLAYSKSKNSYIAKWCKSENLQDKVKKLKTSTPDARILSRMPIERHEKAREITKKMNEDNGTFVKRGRYDQFEWSTNPNYLNSFKSWDANGNKIK